MAPNRAAGLNHRPAATLFDESRGSHARSRKCFWSGIMSRYIYSLCIYIVYIFVYIYVYVQGLYQGIELK